MDGASVFSSSMFLIVDYVSCKSLEISSFIEFIYLPIHLFIVEQVLLTTKQNHTLPFVISKSISGSDLVWNIACQNSIRISRTFWMVLRMLGAIIWDTRLTNN